MKVTLTAQTKVPQLARLGAWARAVCRAQKQLQGAGHVSIIFVSDKALRKINVAFLNHDYNTDVIAFAYPAPPLPVQNFPFGDIYISVDMARAQSKNCGHSLTQELALMIVHGLLHLAGYDDHSVLDQRKMFARQSRLFALHAPALDPGPVRPGPS